MVPKNLLILGSTGSIGKSTLEVVDAHPGEFVVRGLAAYSNVDLLVKQYHKYKPEALCLVDESKADNLKAALKNEKVTLLFGEKELVGFTSFYYVDIVVNAVVGAAGLLASIETVKQGRTLAVANKESLVCGGPLFPELIKQTKAKILPIDSEHSAIWQSAMSGKEDEIKNIILTASGGPFRNLPKEKFESITKAQALNHPTWKMGNKITIDSATLANKGLEVMEAVVLFSVPASKIKVVVHPQSIIHSMVEFNDSSVIAQLSNPDMKLPISYALFWPKRVESSFGALDFAKIPDLSFEEPDYNKFRALKLAFDSAEKGGTAPAVYNAANEIAVEAFLNEKIKFTEITDCIDESLQKLNIVSQPNLLDILEADKETRLFTKDLVGKKVC